MKNIIYKYYVKHAIKLKLQMSMRPANILKLMILKAHLINRFKKSLIVHWVSLSQTHAFVEKAYFKELEEDKIIYYAPPSLVGKGGHTLLLRDRLRGFDPRQLRRTKRAFFPPLAIWNEAQSPIQLISKNVERIFILWKIWLLCIYCVW